MINENIRVILNEQINKEFYSAYLYLSMSAYFDQVGLYGFSKWTKIQAQEEVDHGMIIFEYLNNQDAQIELLQIDKPDFYCASPLSIFEKIYEHEKYVTQSIENIAKASLNECDLMTKNFINWYINEQLEEEKTVSDVISMLKLFGNDGSSLFLIDMKLAEREYQKHTYN